MLIKLKGNLGQRSTESTLKTTTLNFELNEVVLEPKGYLTVELYLLERLYSGFENHRFSYAGIHKKYPSKVFKSNFCILWDVLKSKGNLSIETLNKRLVNLG